MKHKYITSLLLIAAFFMLHSTNANAICGDSGGGNTDNQFGTFMKVFAQEIFDTGCNEYVLDPADLDEDLEKSYGASISGVTPFDGSTGSTTVSAIFSIPGFGFIVDSDTEYSGSIFPTSGRGSGSLGDTVSFIAPASETSYNGTFELCSTITSSLPLTSTIDTSFLTFSIIGKDADVILDFNPAGSDFVIDIPVIEGSSILPLAIVQFIPTSYGTQCATGSFDVSNIVTGADAFFEIKLGGSGETVVNTGTGGSANIHFESYFKFTDVSAGVSCSALSGSTSACGDLGVLPPIDVINPFKCENGCETSVGNPVNFSLGFKHQTETDYAGGVLAFTRNYRSDAYWYSHSVGQRWRHNFDRSITVNGNIASVVNEAGLIHTFENDGSSNNWAPISDDSDQTASIQTIAGGYVLTTQSDIREYYNIQGLLTRVEYRGGEALNLIYDPQNRLSTVSDEKGKSLAFTYNGSENRTSSVSTPDGVYSYAYDANSNLASVTKPDTKTIIYHYEDVNFVNALTGITDENNVRYATYGYDSEGRAVSSKHAGGVDSFTITNNTDDSVTTTNPLGKQTTYFFKTIKGVRRIVNVEGHASANCAAANKASTYDANGWVTSKTDWKGNLTTYIRNSRGLATSITEANGSPEERTTTYSYDPVYRLVDVKSEPGLTTDNDYDAQGRIISTTLTDSATAKVRTTTYSYHPDTVDAFGNVIFGRRASIDGSRTDVSDITTYEYNADFNLIKVTNALGHETKTLSFDAANRPLLTEDQNLVQTALVYDTLGRLKSSTQGLGTALEATTSYNYDNYGNVLDITLPNGVVISYTYDDVRRLVGMEDSLGNTMTYVLDNAGNRISEFYKDSIGTLRYSSTQVFDELSRLLKSIDANNDTMFYSYDVNSNQTGIIDGNLNPTTYAFDGLDRLISNTNALNGQTLFDYNSLNKNEGITDPRDNTTIYSYNAFGDLVQEVSPDRGIIDFTHDNAGNMLSRTDARGVLTTYAYDALNRVISTSYSTETSRNASFVYDAPQGCGYSTGKLCSVLEQGGVVAALEDECATLDPNSGRLATRLCSTFQSNGATPSFYKTLNRTCNAMEKEFQRKGANSARYDGVAPLCAARQLAQSTAYTYDELGRLRTVIESRGTLELTTAYSYDLARIPTAITLPSGRVISYGLNAKGQISSVDTDVNGIPTTLADAIIYLPFGGIESLSYGNGIALTNSFNTAYQLINRQIDTLMNEAYVYDAAGNITIKGTDSYIYDELYRLTDEDGNAGLFSYSYDAIANRLTADLNGSAITYDYPPENSKLSVINASSITYDGAGNITSDTQRNYVIDGAGQVKEVSISGITAGQYAYNANNQRTQKIVNGVTTHYVYGTGGLLYGEYDASGNLIREYVYLNGEPLAQIDAGASEVLSYLHTDHLGTPRYASNTSSVQVWNWQSDAFGNGTPSGSATVNLRFAGQYWDDESSLHYNWNRYYDPETGRYITSDPIGLAGGLNTFGYVLANPVMFTDPEGLVLPAVAICLANPICVNAAAAAGVTVYCYITGICQKATETASDIVKGVIESCTGSASNSREGCPPCDPPVGVKFDKVTHYESHSVLEGKGSHGCEAMTGSPVHWHYLENNQNPQTCECFAKRVFGGCGEAPL